MASWNMPFAEAIQLGRALTTGAKEIVEQLDEYMDTMPLPESIDSCGRLTIKMWVHHFMNGVCTLETLENVLNGIGAEKLLELPQHQMAVDKDGRLTVYDMNKGEQNE